MFDGFVFERATNPGTGPFALSGAIGGIYGSYATAFGNGKKAAYVARARVAPFKWEEGVAVITTGSPDTLARTPKRSFNGSTRGTSVVNFTADDGIIDIYCTAVDFALNGLMATHRGTSAPEWAMPGMMWEDITGAPTGVLLKIMDAGGSWLTLATINETADTIEASGGYVKKVGDAMTGPLSVTSNTSPQVNAISAQANGFARIAATASGTGTAQASVQLAVTSHNFVLYTNNGTNKIAIANTALGDILSFDGTTGSVRVKGVYELDATSYLGISTHPTWVFDSAAGSFDYMQFDRTANTLNFVLANSAVASLDANGFHSPSNAKAWIYGTLPNSITASYNVSGMTTVGTGQGYVNFATGAMGGGNWAGIVTAMFTTDAFVAGFLDGGQHTASSGEILSRSNTNNNLGNTKFHAVFFANGVL